MSDSKSAALFQTEAKTYDHVFGTKSTTRNKTTEIEVKKKIKLNHIGIE